MKNKFTEFFNKRNIPTSDGIVISCILLFWAANMLACIVAGMLTDGNALTAVLYGGTGSEQFTAFFDSLRKTNNVYYDYYSNGSNPMITPLSALFFHFINSLLSAELTEQVDATNFDYLMDQRSMIIFVLVMAAATLIIFRLTENRMAKVYTSPMAKLFCVAMFFSYPMIYSLERGDTMLITASFVLIFFFFKDSANDSFRSYAILSLAIASAFAFWPLIFIVTLIPEKRFKEIIKLVILAVVMTVLPILIFRFSYNTNVLILADGYFNLASESIGITSVIPGIAGTVIMYITCAIAVFAIFFTKDGYKRVLLTMYILLNFAGISSVGTVILLIAPLVMALNKKDKAKSDIANIAIMAASFIPYPVFWYREDVDVFNLNKWVAAIAIQSLFVSIIVTDVIPAFRKKEIRGVKNVEA